MERKTTSLLKSEMKMIVANEQEAVAACDAIGADAQSLIEELRAMVASAEVERDAVVSEHEKLRDSHEQIRKTKSTLLQKYRRRKSDVEVGRSEQAALQEAHDELKREHQVKHEAFSTSNAELLAKYETLMNQQKELCREYSEGLAMLCPERQVIALDPTQDDMWLRRQLHKQDFESLAEEKEAAQRIISELQGKVMSMESEYSHL
jgi:predicted  nucleic acid-binding Zn-ribbon protein